MSDRLFPSPDRLTPRAALGGLLGTAALLLTACGGGGSSDSTSGSIGNSGGNMDTFQVSNGFGLMLPHQVLRADSSGFPIQGNPPVAIDSVQDLVDNVTVNNPILPTPTWPQTAILPTGVPGNHFIYARFTQPLDIASVLDSSSAAQVNSGLTGAITVVGIDPLTGSITPIRGRAFVGGQTYAGASSGGELPLQTWVALDGGLPAAQIVDGEVPGDGFPGTNGNVFQGIADLVSPNTFVFIPDTNGDLSAPFETFPDGLQIRMRITTSVLSQSGKALIRPAVASSTVGADDIPPEVLLSPPPFSFPTITPGNGDTNVDPLTDIVVEFSEPIQPITVGDLLSDSPPNPSSSILVQFGPSASTVTVPYSVMPDSVLDLTRLRLTPAFSFPGSGPVAASCGVFSDVSVTVTSNQLQDLSGNRNTLGPGTGFSTGEGPGLVNSVVAPDALYVGRIQAESTISVVDLNGFGQGTGNPGFDPDEFIQGNTNFPNNPNVAFQATAMIPPLQIGSCTVDGGSSGVFTLQRDASLRDELVGSPLIESISDMALGHALDLLFNNGPPPFGCQAGGGNLCAQTGLKQVSPVPAGANTVGPVQAGQFAAAYQGAENLISWAPHPNPPPLVFPPPCISPFIGGQEPTSVDTAATNLLVPGPFPLGVPPNPPLGLLTREQNSFFLGPSAPQQVIGACSSFGIRQQIGHYLYVADRVRNEVVVLNSNRFSVIDRIPVPDPTDFAMSPNLDLLAVTNQVSGTVTFIDVDPASPGFHTIFKTVSVGDGPTGVAWEPGNEDILVCNEIESSISIISAFSLEVRKTVNNQLNRPFDLAITPRQVNYGFNRQVYFAYFLNRDGSISLFESGPDGVNGWGFDNIIGQPEFTFANPKAIEPDHINLNSGVWVCHEGQIDPDGNPTGLPGGAVSNMVVKSGSTGPIPLSQGGFFQNPTLRDLNFEVVVSVGSDQLTGVPVDLAFDNQMNQGALPNNFTAFSAGTPAPFNGKHLVRGLLNTNEPSFLFCAVPNSEEGGGVIDVVRLDTGFVRTDTNPFIPGVQSIPADGAAVLMDYFRQ